jgi:hypothetical protein
MKFGLVLFLGLAFLASLFVTCSVSNRNSVTLPIKLDHNRMLVKAEIQKPDSSWRDILLWVDTGNPEFFISESLALDLGIDLSGVSGNPDIRTVEVSENPRIRMGSMFLNFEGTKIKIIMKPKWLFTTMHIDANLPSTVLMKYQVVFDYPRRKLILAQPGSIGHRGIYSPAIIHPVTGIVQLMANIYGDSLSFALDNGASYSFASDAVLEKILGHKPDCSKTRGALGCANIWGWWPAEAEWDIIRVPEIHWGSAILANVGLVGLPDSFPLAVWYSQKSARPVDGLLGPNAFRSYRVEIDYHDSAVYFEKGSDEDIHDMDIVGLTLRPETDGNYSVIGIAEKDGRPSVEGVKRGDILLRIDDLPVKNSTMGTVADALRGKPGDFHRLLLERNGQQYEVLGKVIRFL